MEDEEKISIEEQDENARQQLEIKHHFEQMEKYAEISEKITNSLAQFHEFYVAGQKLVVKFNVKGEVEKGIDLFVENAKMFDCNFTLILYANGIKSIEVTIPNNNSIFSRVDADQMPNFMIQTFAGFDHRPKKVNLEFAFHGDPSIVVDGNFSLSVNRNP